MDSLNVNGRTVNATSTLSATASSYTSSSSTSSSSSSSSSSSASTTTAANGGNGSGGGGVTNGFNSNLLGGFSAANPGHNGFTSHDDHTLRECEAYVNKHNIKDLLKDCIVQLCLRKPDNPITFLRQHFEKLEKEQKNNKRNKQNEQI